MRSHFQTLCRLNAPLTRFSTTVYSKCVQFESGYPDIFFLHQAPHLCHTLSLHVDMSRDTHLWVHQTSGLCIYFLYCHKFNNINTLDGPVSVCSTLFLQSKMLGVEFNMRSGSNIVFFSIWLSCSEIQSGCY